MFRQSPAAPIVNSSLTAVTLSKSGCLCVGIVLDLSSCSLKNIPLFPKLRLRYCGVNLSVFRGSLAIVSQFSMIPGTQLLRSQRLSQNLQTIEAFEANASRTCVRFEWERFSRVLQAQRRKQWQRVKQPFPDSVACVHRMVKRSFGGSSAESLTVPFSRFCV